MRRFSSFRQCSMMFESGELGGQGRTVRPRRSKWVLAKREVCFGSLSCWKTYVARFLSLSLLLQAEKIGKYTTIHLSVHFSMDLGKFARSVWGQDAPKHDASTAMFQGRLKWCFLAALPGLFQ